MKSLFTKKSARRQRKMRDHKGSALLVALIIMGILMTIAIGVSEVLIRSVRDSRQLIDRTTAWYRAESGIETALDKVTRNPPGFQEKDISVTAEDGTKQYSYSITAASNVVPQSPYENAPTEETYSDLPLGQTVNIPLFSAAKNEADGESETVHEVKEFQLFYYLNSELQMKGGKKSDDLDIVRWKIFGRNNTTKANEVINGLIPEKKINIDGTEQVSCLGTASTSSCFSRGKYYKLDVAGGPSDFTDEEPIDNFLQTHSENFLAITNMINIDFIAGPGPEEKKQLSTIKYKLRQLGNTGDEQLTLPTIKVTADGFEKNTKQSIDIEVNRERSLPVFNYALYRTKSE